MLRWFMKTGQRQTTEDIAARSGCTVAAVESSLARVEAYRLYYSHETVVMKANEAVLDKMTKVGKVFDRGLEAKKTDKRGRRVHDIDTQLKTVNTMRSFAEMGMPQAPAVQLNQQFNNIPGQSGGTSGGNSFESWLRNKRAQSGQDNGEDYIEGEEMNEEQSVEDELADIGIELDEDDDEGDEE